MKSETQSSPYTTREELYCALGNKNTEKGSCLNETEMREMVIAYNKWCLKQNSGKHKLVKVNDDTKKMWSKLLKRFHSTCKGNEHCLTQQKFVSEIQNEIRESINSSYPPPGPQNPTEWLSNFDIEKIMKVREKHYKDFKFIGAVADNCQDKIGCPMYDLNFGKIYDQGYRKFGIIFNRGTYENGGTHWLAYYMNTEDGSSYFYDSVGRGPSKNMRNVINKYEDFCSNKLKKKHKYNENKISHQKDNTECGVFSCNFIVRMLRGEKYDDIIGYNPSHEEINSCRNVYFVNKPSKYKPSQMC